MQCAFASVYTLKNKGAKTQPCGAPVFNTISTESSSFLSLCGRSVQKSLTQYIKPPFNSKSRSLCRRTWTCAVLKAAVKSTNKKGTNHAILHHKNLDNKQRSQNRYNKGPLRDVCLDLFSHMTFPLS